LMQYVKPNANEPR